MSCKRRKFAGHVDILISDLFTVLLINVFIIYFINCRATNNDMITANVENYKFTLPLFINSTYQQQQYPLFYRLRIRVTSNEKKKRLRSLIQSR